MAASRACRRYARVPFSPSPQVCDALPIRRKQGRSDGGYIGIYTPKISLPYKFLCGYWLFLFDPGQIRYREGVRISSCFFYLLTTIYTPPNEIPGYATGRKICYSYILSLCALPLPLGRYSLFFYTVFRLLPNIRVWPILTKNADI